MTEKSYATSIKLPSENVFRNLKSARRFAIDIGLYYENLTMQYTENFLALKIENFIGKKKIFLIVLLKTLIVGTH